MLTLTSTSGKVIVNLNNVTNIYYDPGATAFEGYGATVIQFIGGTKLFVSETIEQIQDHIAMRVR